MGDTNRRYHLISVIRTAVHILSSYMLRCIFPPAEDVRLFW
jgi:hypothetical protein